MPTLIRELNDLKRRLATLESQGGVVITGGGTGGGGGNAGGLDGHTIMDEGVALTQRSALDFQGAGVTASDDATTGRTIVTVSGGGSGSGSGSDAFALFADTAGIVWQPYDAAGIPKTTGTTTTTTGSSRAWGFFNG